MAAVGDKTTRRVSSSQEKSNEEIPNFLKWISTIRAFVCTHCQMLIGLSGVVDENAAQEYATSLKRHLGEVHLLSFKTHILNQHVIKHLKQAVANNTPFVPFAPSATPHERLPIPVENAFICPKSKAANSTVSSSASLCGFVALNRTNMLQHYAQAHPHESLPVNLEHCNAQKGFSNQFYVRVVDDESSSSKRKQFKAERPSSEDADESGAESDAPRPPKKQRASDVGLEPPDLRESLRQMRDFFATIRFDPAEDQNFEPQTITDAFIWVPESASKDPNANSDTVESCKVLLTSDAMDRRRGTVWLVSPSTETLGDTYLRIIDEADNKLQIVRFLSLHSEDRSKFRIRVMICKYMDSDLPEPFGEDSDGHVVNLWDNQNFASVYDSDWALVLAKVLSPAYELGGDRTAALIGWPSFATLFYAAQCVTWPNTNEKIFKGYRIGAPPSFDLARDYAIFQLENKPLHYVVD